jgi:hypothetical protein
MVTLVSVEPGVPLSKIPPPWGPNGFMRASSPTFPLTVTLSRFIRFPLKMPPPWLVLDDDSFTRLPVTAASVRLNVPTAKTPPPCCTPPPPVIVTPDIDVVAVAFSMWITRSVPVPTIRVVRAPAPTMASPPLETASLTSRSPLAFWSSGGPLPVSW